MPNAKYRFLRKFKERFFLRFHMSLILLGTGLIGLLGTKLLLWCGIENVLIRYPLNVVIAYLGFFLFVKIWLWYISPNRSDIDPFDAIDIVPTPDGSTGPAEPGFIGGGGTSGGGGASGSFEGFTPSSGSGSSGGGGIDIDLDGEGILPLIILGALLAAVFGGGIYLIYQAPAILTDAAFEFLLATGMLKGFRRMDDPDWFGSVFRTTWIPFVAVLLIAVLSAWAMHAYYPTVVTLRDLF